MHPTVEFNLVGIIITSIDDVQSILQLGSVEWCSTAEVSAFDIFHLIQSHNLSPARFYDLKSNLVIYPTSRFIRLFWETTKS